MYFLGGIQIFCIGMLGEYLGKAYQEVKARPRFFIEKTAPAVWREAGNPVRTEIAPAERRMK
jgi:hypothetical protein